MLKSGRNSFQANYFFVLAKFGILNAFPYRQSLFEAYTAMIIIEVRRFELYKSQHYEIWVSHSGFAEYSRLLGCYPEEDTSGNIQRHSVISNFISAINFSFELTIIVFMSGENTLLRITTMFLTDSIPFHCTVTMEHTNELNHMLSIYCLLCLTGQ